MLLLRHERAIVSSAEDYCKRGKMTDVPLRLDIHTPYNFNLILLTKADDAVRTMRAVSLC